MTTFTLRNYDHDGLFLNVTLDRSKYGCVLEKITAGRDDQDISHLFSKATLDSMVECVDAQLSHEARRHNAAARAELHQWHREFAIA